MYTHTHTHTHTRAHAHAHTHTGIFLIHKKWNAAICSNMDRQRDKYCMMESKNIMNELICKTETDSQTENKLMVTKGGKQGGISYEINIYTLLYIK